MKKQTCDKCRLPLPQMLLSVADCRLLGELARGVDSIVCGPIHESSKDNDHVHMHPMMMLDVRIGVRKFSWSNRDPHGPDRFGLFQQALRDAIAWSQA